jgi:hypothetical protein
MGQVQNKYEVGRFKPNTVNNHIKHKWPKVIQGIIKV